MLVSGEAGVGKTALLRRFCEECGRSVRVLWGGCDPLFTPRPLGPLLAVAESAGGELEALVGSGALPHEVVAALARELRRCSDGVRARGRALGGRGHARRLEIARAPGGDGSCPDRRELSRRRARPGAPAANRGRRAGDQSDGQTAQARCSLAGGGRAACRAVRRRRGASSTARPPATRSSSLRRWPREAMRFPDTVRDAVFARAARLGSWSAAASRGGRSRPAAGRALAAGGACRRRARRARRVPDVGHADVRAGGHRVPARARAARRRGIGRAQPRARPASQGARGARGPTGTGLGSGAARAPRRGGRRCRGGASLRTRGGGPRGVARCASRGGRAVRARSAVRRSTSGGRARGAARGSRARVLFDRSVRRRDCGARAGARTPASAGRRSQGRRRAASAFGVLLVPWAHRGIRSLRPRRRLRSSKPYRPAASSPGRTPTSR